VRAIGAADHGDIREAPREPQRGAPVPRAVRPVFIHEAGGLCDVPIHFGHRLGAGARIEGPAVIEEETTTILLFPGMTAEADMYGNYSVRL